MRKIYNLGFPIKGSAIEITCSWHRVFYGKEEMELIVKAAPSLVAVVTDTSCVLIYLY
jgi:hypothetical protein